MWDGDSDGGGVMDPGETTQEKPPWDWCNGYSCAFWIEGNECGLGKSIESPDGDYNECDEYEYTGDGRRGSDLRSNPW